MIIRRLCPGNRDRDTRCMAMFSDSSAWVTSLTIGSRETIGTAQA